MTETLCGKSSEFGPCTLNAGHLLPDNHCSGCDSNGDHHEWCEQAAGQWDEEDW